MKHRKISKKSKSQIIQEKEQRTSNVLNLGKLMRKHSDGMKVSPSAVRAMADRIDLFLETAMPQIARIAKSHGCKKIKEIEDLEHPEKSQAHITWYFGLIGSNLEHVANITKKGYRWELVKMEKNKGEKL